MGNSRICIVIAVLGILSGATLAFADDDNPDSDDIARWRAGAERGDTHSQFMLGNAYLHGEAVAPDDKEAAKWFLRAAQQGDPDAQFNIGFAYRGGNGIPRDPVMAYMWFDLASQQGIESAAELRNDVAGSMTYEQITKARKLVHEWKPIERGSRNQE